MNDRMIRLVKRNLRKVDDQTRPFYFVEERVREGSVMTLRRVLHVSEKKLKKPKYNTLDKINGHLARRAKDVPFSKKARLCAGLVVLEGSTLRFEIVMKKGIGHSQLIKGLRKLNTEHKLGMKTGNLFVGRPGKATSEPRPEKTVKTWTAKINGLYQKLKGADPVPEAGIEKLIRRLARYDDAGGTPGPVAEARAFAEASFARLHDRDEEDEVRVMEREVKTWVEQAAEMEAELSLLLEEDTSPEVLDTAIAQIEGARRLIEETITRLQAFLDEED